MTHDEITELLGVYALDAVEPDERDEIEEHLLTCVRCRAEVAEHREVAAMLAHGGTDAPEGLWDVIAGSLEEAPPRLDLAPVSDLQAGARRRRPSPLAAVVAVAAALLVAVLGVQVNHQGQRIDELQTALRDPMQPAYEAARGDPRARDLELTSGKGDVVVRGTVTPDGIGYLAAESLPALAPGRTYQLWGATGDELVSLGVLGAHPKVISFRGADGYRTFAITEEAAPGVVRSRNQPVVAGSATA